jgi:hypothetical protein
MFEILYGEFFNVIMYVSLVIQIIVFYEWDIILVYMISNHFLTIWYSSTLYC